MKGISIKTRNWLLILQATSLESWLKPFEGVVCGTLRELNEAGVQLNGRTLALHP